MYTSTAIRTSGSVALVAEADSVLGAWVASHLSTRHFRLDRVGFGNAFAGEQAAAVILMETEASIEMLRAAFSRSMRPTLVLVSSPELAMHVLPLLEPWHDLAPVTEAPDVIAWRLQRLIDFARRSALGQQAVDTLTGLLNRSTFEQQTLRVASSLAAGEYAGLVYLDLDRFKDINDARGHAAGDRVLKAVARVLQRAVAPGDLVGRLGGDEFGCVLKRNDADSVRRDAEHLLAAIASVGRLEAIADPAMPKLTASAGLAYLRPAIDGERLRAEADQAMYQAKSGGRNRIEVFAVDRDDSRDSGEDAALKHLENVTRVAAERLIGMITSKSRKLVDAANEKANICPLTGLGNIGFFNKQLPLDMYKARLNGRPLSLVFIDLDNFRHINSDYLWSTGNRVLQAFAKTARASVRSTDWIVRYGGEEFAIVMPDTTLDAAMQVAERFRQAFAAAEIESVDGRRVAATLSAGVAQLPAGVESTEAFVNLASEALAVAKSSGRNRVEQYQCCGTAATVVNKQAGEPGKAPADHGNVMLAPEIDCAAATPTEDPFDLARFVEAQSDLYQRFIAELRRGRKLRHCMWFMFPQLVGLGYSYESRRYGIRSLDEAAAYLAHPLLGARLRECAEALLMLDAQLSVDDVFDDPDDLKLRSCLTLFALAAGPGSVFERLIDRFFDGTRDHITVARLGRWSAAAVAYHLGAGGVSGRLSPGTALRPDS